MSKTPLAEYMYEGYLFYPWQGQVRFVAALVDGKLVLGPGLKENDQYIENCRAPTMRRYSEVDEPLFESIKQEIIRFLEHSMDAETTIEGSGVLFGGQVVKGNHTKEKIWIRMVRVYKAK